MIIGYYVQRFPSIFATNFRIFLLKIEASYSRKTKRKRQQDKCGNLRIFLIIEFIYMLHSIYLSIHIIVYTPSNTQAWTGTLATRVKNSISCFPEL